jgi:hypothetical protein
MNGSWKRRSKLDYYCHAIGPDAYSVCSHFGKAGTAYDFNAHDIQEAKEKFKELEESQKGLKTNVNPKVINMIDTYVVLAN